jgi:hypothetical protein
MAAGMGSRFGKGIKQLEHVGPSGEILMDYSIYDAAKAGFDKVVIVIRKDIEDEFKRLIGDRISKHVNMEYVYQDIDDLPEGFTKPADRTKPWGTGHAILSAAKAVDTPFAVINADDFYGREAFVKMHDYLAKLPENDEQDYCMAGYILGNTLSDNGTVTRGICIHEDDYYLKTVEESFELRLENGVVVGKDSKGNDITAPKDALVSMNMWGCKPVYFKQLQEDFVSFLEGDGDPLKKEFLLPIIMDNLIKQGKAKIKILPVSERWFGLTYIADKPMIVEKLNKIIEEGVYPANLWG